MPSTINLPVPDQDEDDNIWTKVTSNVRTAKALQKLAKTVRRSEKKDKRAKKIEEKHPVSVKNDKYKDPPILESAGLSKKQKLEKFIAEYKKKMATKVQEEIDTPIPKKKKLKVSDLLLKAEVPQEKVFKPKPPPPMAKDLPKSAMPGTMTT